MDGEYPLLSVVPNRNLELAIDDAINMNITISNNIILNINDSNKNETFILLQQAVHNNNIKMRNSINTNYSLEIVIQNNNIEIINLLVDYANKKKIVAFIKAIRETNNIQNNNTIQSMSINNNSINIQPPNNPSSNNLPPYNPTSNIQLQNIFTIKYSTI
ncbi:hypothetical protein H8356DRAFT_1400142 [Neocallimastix lanati (nom. inval.)]|nr:hypothetical protein H8356DRAFT_1400142 [Neocallimastix sp. JGI-2020a]